MCAVCVREERRQIFDVKYSKTLKGTFEFKLEEHPLTFFKVQPNFNPH